MIVDPSDVCADPLVLTGSHNWTLSANTKNDENTLIIHDDTAANVYYQSFYANFLALGGTLVAQRGCGVAVPEVSAHIEDCKIYPNPTTGHFTIAYTLGSVQPVTIEVFDVLGRKTATLADNMPQKAGNREVDCSITNPGIYMVRIATGSEQLLRTIVVSQ
jgi:phosphatidylserine/phosphatidylglycerophosphate/cardiolipin synthase-like enzyme